MCVAFRSATFVNKYLYDAEGRMCAVQTNSISGGTAMTEYIYDAEGHRVAKGSITVFSCNPGANGFVAGQQEVIGPGGQAVTETDGSGNWQHTNVYAGSQLLATYDSAGLHFFLTDPLGTRRVQVNAAGQVEGTDASLPYGDGFAQTAQDDPNHQHFAQLTYDPESQLDHAEARQYAAWMGRWTAPDPYNGSYDLANPQSLNRYAYVNNNPLGFVDPSGLAGGVTGWGGICNLDKKKFNGNGTPGYNPCNPVDSIISIALTAALSKISSSITAQQVAPVVGATITIACSIDNFSNTMCGQSGWTSAFIGGDAGKVVSDTIAAVGAIAALAQAAATANAIANAATATGCIAGGPADPACDVLVAYDIYTIANGIFSDLWSAFGPAKFEGSMLPRPAALDGLGSSVTGIPDKNLSIQEILGQTSTSKIPTP